MEICLLCGFQGSEAFLTKKDHIRYYRCTRCDYVFRDRGFRLSAIDEKRRYELHENSMDDAGYRAWLNRFLDFALNPPLFPDSRVLDFGSGPVPNLAILMMERGYSVETEDPFFSPEVPEGKFSLITALEVFEHLANPLYTLKNLASRLTPDGRMCISTEFLPNDRKLFDTWHYRSDQTHIGFFTKQGLNLAASYADLEPDGGDDIRYASFRLAQYASSC